MDSLNNKETLNDLIISFLSGNISSEEISELAELLNNSAENQQLFEEIKEAWISSSSYTPDSSVLLKNQSWEKVRTAINSNNIGGSMGPKATRYSFSRIIRIAASWAALIAFGSLSTMFILSQKGHKASICIVSTPLGSKSQITLPDGTQVWLNAGTTVRYPETFSEGQRDLYLTGEAFFKVKTDKSRPFIVHTEKLNIKALGTAFNVKAYPSENKVSTTLVEGIVKLEDYGTSDKKFTYTLKPNQKLTYYTSEPKKEEKILKKTKAIEKILLQKSSISNPVIVNENINTELSTSWKDKRWIIDGENLEDLAVMFERRYDIKVNIASEELKNYKFRGTIENETIEQVLNYLSFTTPLKFEMQKGLVILKINEPLRDKYKAYLNSEKHTN
jgi:ferric-dicitrate binding protein FerR (iron transport regulator)